jgi:hypothetical protein
MGRRLRRRKRIRRAELPAPFPDTPGEGWNGGEEEVRGADPTRPSKARVILSIMRKVKKSNIEEFIALPDAEKERIFNEIASQTTEQLLARSRPLNARERAQWRRFKARTGRPKIGRGAKTISLTVEKDLLIKADAYAKRHGMSRAKLVAKALQAIIG